MTGVINSVIGVAGMSINGRTTRDADSAIAHSPTPAAGKAGSLTTRTDDNTGVATMSNGHGIQSADLVDVYWTGGVRYGMVATVATNAVTLEGGAGDALPAQATAVVLGVVTVIDTDLDGDLLVKLIAHSSRRAHIDIRSAAASLAAIELPANEPFQWVNGTILTNPLAGGTVDVIRASCGETTAAVVNVGILYDGT